LDITRELSDPALTREIKLVADLLMVREFLGEWQQEICADTWKVTEGRDQGTEVFPEAIVKIYLIADFDERVNRRRRQMEAEGRVLSEDGVNALAEDMAKRDKSDRERPVGALRQPEGSFLLDNSELSLDETEEAALGHINKVLTDGGIVLPSGS
jgi:cytidylate kinase